MLALTNLGWAEETLGVDNAGAARETEQAMRIGTALGAESLNDLQISTEYAFAGGWRVNALVALGRNDEALQVGKAAIAVADGVLARRPWYRLTLGSRQDIDGSMVGAAEGQLEPREAREFALQEQESSRTLVSFDPKDVGTQNNLAVAMTDVCLSLWAGGQLREALGWCQKSFAVWAAMPKGLTGSFVVQVRYLGSRMAHWQAVSGDLAGAANSAANDHGLFASGAPPQSTSGNGWFGGELDAQIVQAEVMYERGDFAAAARLAGQGLTQLQSAKPMEDVDKLAQAYLLHDLSNAYGHAEYQLGHFALTERAAHVALGETAALIPFFSSALDSKRDSAEISTWLAMSLARQGRLREAARVIDPVVAFEGGLLARDHGDVWVPYELAQALYAQALAEPTQRDTALKRAAALLSGLPPRLQRLHDVRQWQHWVARSHPAQ
jgi:tetratricopeptide (TPR) repeat protein